ncbi:MAG: ATP phosphoribosyltransferase [Dethiobacter sp.]|jgi:ATP phosphoribosyltransferase|nr:ATP phosphoribosyltransferase [Dethiobacter sp.]MBS3897216.1 ATP phosphoribosyltransferase [Dethiobacter sp.]MBS3982460.1 ATP phosphoribosyltransferase [Dethiobacter sp.]MCL4462542.1 ATP phosphoribosyltransferase [Bacillota bacterium]MCL5993170.1 ATP phosphoribosyltransferase [Bacillota bacterium]
MVNKDWLTVALAKGRMLPPALELFEKAGIGCGQLRETSRKLVFTVEEHKLRFILAKPMDIPTYVEYGVADLGVVGKDVLMEQEKELYELLDLKIGPCRLAVAQKCGGGKFNGGYVATKYPRVAERYFQGQGKQAEVIKLHGSIELAPLLNLADAIVDLVSTGKTLIEHHLEEIEVIAQITSRLVANPGSYQVKGVRVTDLLQRLEAVLTEGEAKPC